MTTKTLHPDPEFTLDAARPDPGSATGSRSTTPARAGRGPIALIATLLLVLGAVAAYFLWPRGAPAPLPVAPIPAASSPAPAAAPEPANRHPVDQIRIAPAPDGGLALPPLPVLDESDTVARDSIATILNGEELLRLLAPAAIIRHIVATVDNLPRKTIATRILPVKPVPGAFATATAARGMSIAPDNAARYRLYVRAAESIDPERLAQFYVRLYPLFQQAYVELGYPSGYFNDRLIAVIDHLLAAPEPGDPVYLTQPKVVYEFADPELEHLSAGQKILVRIGVDNEMRVKAKLRALRTALAGKAAKP
jgi:hypothetical protein